MSRQRLLEYKPLLGEFGTLFSGDIPCDVCVHKSISGLSHLMFERNDGSCFHLVRRAAIQEEHMQETLPWGKDDTHVLLPCTEVKFVVQ